MIVKKKINVFRFQRQVRM